jgi:hypothetical protein
VLGDDDSPVGPVERYLAFLTDIERSPTTVRAYAHDLKDWSPPGTARPGLARGCSGGRRRVRGLAASPAGRPERPCRAPSLGWPPRERFDGEPDTLCAGRVLPAYGLGMGWIWAHCWSPGSRRGGGYRLCLEASRRSVRAVERFAQFLASTAVNALSEVDRPLLERYLAEAWRRSPVRPAVLHVVKLEPEAAEVPAWIRVDQADACNLPGQIVSGHYDRVFCNSVIEHVGGHSQRQRFADTVHALADRQWVQAP